MSPGDIRSAYILYIGAGAVTAGGLISLARAMPTIWRSLRAGLADFSPKPAAAAAMAEVPRTDRDISLKWVALGVLGLVAAILVAHSLHMNIVGALLIVLFGFMFVTVSSRLTGELGSSSNPISGMTVATLLLTCLISWCWGGRAGLLRHRAPRWAASSAIAGLQRRNDVTGPEDRLPARPQRPRAQAARDPWSAPLLPPWRWAPSCWPLNQAATVYVPVAPAAAVLSPRLRPSTLHGSSRSRGSQEPRRTPAPITSGRRPDPTGGAQAPAYLSRPTARSPTW
jgi:hypothetical protein